MNLGVERFLILGCVAVLVMEVPQLIQDWRIGDGFVEPRPAPVVVELEQVELLEQLVLDELQVELPGTPGL